MNRSTLRIAIIVLGVATAILHLYAGVAPMRPPLLLNGVGYLVLLAALLLDVPFLQARQKWVGYVFLGYTLITILLWIPAGDKNLVGYVDKVIEIILAAALYLFQRNKK